VKNGRKTIGIEEKLDIRSRLKKREQTVHICHDVRLARSRVRTIRDNAHTINEGAKYLDSNKCQQSEPWRVCVARLPQSSQNEPYQKLWTSLLYFIL
jgi:hypothetical protein